MKLCFDCDDTLYDLSYPFKKSLEYYFGIDSSWNLTEMYAYYRTCGDEIFDKVQTGEISTDQSGEYRALKMCKKYGLDMDEEKAVAFQKKYKEYQYKIFMSDELHEFFKNSEDELAILSNGENNHQRNKLKSLGVFSYFQEDHIFTSGQLGYAKPDPQCFKEVFSRLNQNPTDWYYIGDNYINDMQGAKSVGMHTIHFNRHHQQEGSASDYIVYTEKELIDLLNTLKSHN